MGTNSPLRPCHFIDHCNYNMEMIHLFFYFILYVTRFSLLGLSLGLTDYIRYILWNPENITTANISFFHLSPCISQHNNIDWLIDSGCGFLGSVGGWYKDLFLMVKTCVHVSRENSQHSDIIGDKMTIGARVSLLLCLRRW